MQDLMGNTNVRRIKCEVTKMQIIRSTATYVRTRVSRKHDESEDDWDRHKKSKSDRHDRKRDKAGRKRARSDSRSDGRPS